MQSGVCQPVGRCSNAPLRLRSIITPACRPTCPSPLAANAFSSGTGACHQRSVVSSSLALPHQHSIAHAAQPLPGATHRPLGGTLRRPTLRRSSAPTAAAATAAGPIDLSEVSDEELRRLEAEWGYSKLGRPLPEGVTAEAIASTLPEDLYQLDMKQVRHMKTNTSIRLLLSCKPARCVKPWHLQQ